MTTLSAARTRGYTNTQTNGLPISTSTTIWGGAAVGIHPTTGAVGLAGPGMLFGGFAKSSVNHIPGQRRDTVVTVVDCGQVVLAVSGAVQADVGKDVYATDDDTFTVSSSAGSFVGVAKQLVSSGKLLVEIAPPSMMNSVRLARGGTALVSGDGTVLVPTIVSLSTDNAAVAASANLSAINTALAAGGDVVLDGAGDSYINGSMVLKSNTRLSCSPRLTIKQYAGTSLAMLCTQAMADFTAGGTTVTVTWSSGIDFTVNWAGHGKTAGSAIVLFGATGALAFNGVFRVHTVTNANSFVCKLRTLPSASPGGTLKAIDAVQNVVIDGLGLDYDATNNAAATDYNKHAAYLYGVCDLELRNMRASNAVKYAYCIQTALSARGLNLMVPWNNSDGLKLYGPLHDVNIVGLAGRAGDDGGSVQAKEAAAFASSVFDFSGGDATAVTVRDVSLSTTNGTVGVFKVYLSDSEFTDKIVVEGVSGASPGATVSVELGAAYTTGLCGKLTFRDIGGNGAYSFRHTSGTVDQIIIENVKANPLTTTGQVVLQDSVAVCRQMIVNGIDLGALNWPSAAVSAVQCAGTVEQLTIRDGIGRTGGAGQTRTLTIVGGSAVKTANLINCKSDGDNFVTVSASVTNAPLINLRGCELTGAAVVNVSSSCDITLSGGNRFNNASNGVVRFSATATVNLRSDGTNKLAAGSWVAAPAGTPTLNVWGSDITVDVGASLGFNKTTIGQFCINNGSGRGTLVQNQPVICNGSAWLQSTALGNTF